MQINPVLSRVLVGIAGVLVIFVVQKFFNPADPTTNLVSHFGAGLIGVALLNIGGSGNQSDAAKGGLSLLLAATAALTIGATPGCLGKNGPVKDDPVWGPVTSCASAGASDAVAEVTDALLNNDTAALEKLAVTYGRDVVACLIKSLTDQWLAPGAAPDPHRLDAAKRGQEFLKAKGVTFPQAWLLRGWVPVPYAYASMCRVPVEAGT